MLNRRSSFSRRNALRGFGLSLAVPWLESVCPVARAASVAPTPPQRMGFIFVPNGVHLPDWTPTTEGFGFQLPYILDPLSPVQDDLLVISGLTHDKGRANGDGPGDHARSASLFLVAVHCSQTADDRRPVDDVDFVDETESIAQPEP